jgi:signal transduction histidine kinase
MAGFAQVLTERLPADASGDCRHYAGRIVANAARAEALVAGILSLVQVLHAPIVPTRVDLSALAHDALEALASAEPHRPVQAEVQPGLAAHGDPRLLDSVLSNLLANAWKFTRERDPARIAVGRSDDGAFFVRDNGVGFAPEDTARLFQPLGRLHGHAGYTGTGLGLATAQRIVQRHGGAMWAEAQPGRGATFWFTLPAAAA